MNRTYLTEPFYAATWRLLKCVHTYCLVQLDVFLEGESWKMRLFPKQFYTQSSFITILGVLTMAIFPVKGFFFFALRNHVDPLDYQFCSNAAWCPLNKLYSTHGSLLN